MRNAVRFRATMFAVPFVALAFQLSAYCQTPVITPEVSIDQKTLLDHCKLATSAQCSYKLNRVLDSGGHFWTTPFQPYDRKTQTGDGYGEGTPGPRSAQRAYFNPRDLNYPFLRVNGLDSQSCFECHNTIGSYDVDKHGAMIRKPFPVGGSAGSNSNAFINPLYSRPGIETLFIRNPPAVFGAGYTQQAAAEMTDELKAERDLARMIAMNASTPGHQAEIELTAKGVDFGKFKTTYRGGNKAIVDGIPLICEVNNDDSPPPGALTPIWVGGKVGFEDDVRGVDGVSCDLVVRPFQWKGIASGLRHFVRDALEFHFSMQAFEKVGECDCDQDGKGGPVYDANGKLISPELVTEHDQGPEIKIGQITAMAAFVAMLRPPVEGKLTDRAKRGRDFFFGSDGKSNCASCHMKEFELRTNEAKIEWPINPMDANYGPVDPDLPDTWAITPTQCPKGNPPNGNTVCPVEFIPGGQMTRDATNNSIILGESKAAFTRNPGSLIDPLVASTQLAVVRREGVNEVLFSKQLDEMMEPAMKLGLQNVRVLSAQQLRQPLFTESQIESIVDVLEKPLGAESVSFRPGMTSLSANSNAASVVGADYVLPLTPADNEISALQRPRLKVRNGKIFVPLMSDLKRHDMGPCLEDPSFQGPGGVYSQGTDVMHIFTNPREYLTRPLWGVADTGPWLHDGRALTLKDAIIMHGDSATCSGSSAAAVVEKFEALTPDQQQDVVEFLLTLRLPPPDNKGPGAVLLEKP